MTERDRADINTQHHHRSSGRKTSARTRSFPTSSPLRDCIWKNNQLEFEIRIKLQPKNVTNTKNQDSKLPIQPGGNKLERHTFKQNSKKQHNKINNLHNRKRLKSSRETKRTSYTHPCLTRPQFYPTNISPAHSNLSMNWRNKKGYKDTTRDI